MDGPTPALYVQILRGDSVLISQQVTDVVDAAEAAESLRQGFFGDAP
jgi:hypothetical protein